MDHATGRRLFWNAAAGFGTGLACTVTTALFATGGNCSDRRLAATLLVCSPLLAAVPAVLTSSPRLRPGSAAVLTGVLAILMGAVNAVVVWLITQTLGGHNYDELGAVLVFSLPFGGIPGAGYAVPLAFGTWFARKGLDAPRPTVGAARGLIATVAIIGTATSALVATTRDLSYSMWPALFAFDSVLAATCIWVAIRDVVWAIRLLRLQRDRTGTTLVVPADPSTPVAGLRHIATCSLLDHAPTHIVRVQSHEQTAPYRLSQVQQPILSLDATPRAVRRALVASAVAFLACAALLTWSAAQMPQLEPRWPSTCGVTQVPAPGTRMARVP